MSERMPAMTAALSVAMSARTGSLTQHAVDDLRTKGEELLPRGDDLRSAILSFATRYEQLKRDQVALKYLGEELQAALAKTLNPDQPALRERRDIDG